MIHRPAGSEFQTYGAMKLKECLPKDFKVRLGIFKSLISLEDRRVRAYRIYIYKSPKLLSSPMRNQRTREEFGGFKSNAESPRLDQVLKGHDTV